MPGCSFSASHGWLNQTARIGPDSSATHASRIDSLRARRDDVRRTTPAIATSSSLVSRRAIGISSAGSS